jgi:hypothetical protein
MAKTCYVWCSCETFGCRSNPDGTGRKVQTTQTAGRHQQADEQLAATRARELERPAVPQGDRVGLSLDPDPEHEVPQTPQFLLDDPISPHAAPSCDPSPLPHPYELQELFEQWEDIPEALDAFDPGEFSSDNDDDLFLSPSSQPAN